VGVVLGGHGITAWGKTSDEAEANSLWMIETARAFIEQHGDPRPLGDPVAERLPLSPVQRSDRAAALAPFLRAMA
jgi:rhamnose utilization protein RhaD (predicted bifunctional aldolase and dehydrogenase)